VGRLIFDGEAVREQVEHAKRCTHFRRAYGQEPEPSLFLVHDSGVYLMSAGIPHLEREDEPESSKVVYAAGCNPDTDEDYYQEAAELVGGDDFVEMLPLDTFEKLFALGLKNIKVVVDLTPTQIVVSYTGGEKQKKPKTVRMPVGIDDLDDF
jgi:hypothetical protein